jgi:hypothetical protein
VLESAAEVQDLVMGPCWTPPDGCQFPPSDPQYQDWVDLGKPNCWCYAKQCYGDADGYLQGSAIFGFKYVSTDDLIILAAAWQINEPPKGLGVGSIPGGVCADFDHKAQGSAVFGFKRVSTDDLIILANNWQINEPPKGLGVPAANCVPSPVDPPPKP